MTIFNTLKELAQPICVPKLKKKADAEDVAKLTHWCRATAYQFTPVGIVHAGVELVKQIEEQDTQAQMEAASQEFFEKYNISKEEYDLYNQVIVDAMNATEEAAQ